MRPSPSATTTPSGSASTRVGAASAEVVIRGPPAVVSCRKLDCIPVRVAYRKSRHAHALSICRQIDEEIRRHADDTRCQTATVTTPRRRIDLNADLGEGFGVWRLGDDDALLGVVTSANVACGFHAGDPATMRRVCARAADAGIAVGAQVSYRDLAGFGRRFIDVEPGELADDVLYQLAALDGMARAVVDAVAAFGGLPVLGLPGSALLRAAESAGLRAVREGFADRGYTAAGSLVSRREPGALVHDPAAVAERAVRMAVDGEVVAVDGTTVRLDVESVCVHGDTDGAVGLARAVRTALETAG